VARSAGQPEARASLTAHGIWSARSRIHIALDVRDSTPDWSPYTPPSAPDGAPNVLIVLHDDTGLAAWEPYGGRIRSTGAASKPRVRIRSTCEPSVRSAT
jgi:hypothetical protein